MRILHTSDWHLGRNLYGKKRDVEFSAFLDWIIETLDNKEIDILLVSGDIFDTTTPSNSSQKLYYLFLNKVAVAKCRHIVITGGNHDSPSFLAAPKELLKQLNIIIIPSKLDIKDEVLELKDPTGKTEAIICAVPYLRDRDIRIVEAGESIDDKDIKLAAGIKSHYYEVCEYAKSIRKENIPIIVMGHLFAAGGKTSEGIRELYVGSLSNLGADIFPDYVDYVALGHLHIPQKVNKSEIIRYSGSPIPMGFGEADQKKIVLVVEFDNLKSTITEVDIPCFQKLIRILGNREEIITKIKQLKNENSNAWLEIEFTGIISPITLQEDINKEVNGSQLEVRIIKNREITRKVLDNTNSEHLEELSVDDVFERCLKIYNINDNDKPLLTSLFKDIVKTMEEEDLNI